MMLLNDMNSEIRKIVTARIRRMREGNIFSLFTLAGEGEAIPGPEGCTPSQVQTGGVGYSLLLMGGPPSQVQTGVWGTPILLRGGGYPL